MEKQQITRFKPSKQPKKRYILFEVKGSGKIFSGYLKAALLNHFRNFFGKDFLQKRIVFIVFFDQKGLGIVRCTHLALDGVKKAINVFKEVGGQAVNFRVILVSGSIKKLKAKIRNNF